MLACAAIISLVLMVAAPGAAQDNLVVNPGFEQVDDAGWAEGWSIWPPELEAGASVTIDDEVAHTGSRSLRISHTSPRLYSRAQQRIAVKPGATYLFTFFVRTDKVQLGDGSQGARLYVEKSTGDRASALQQGTMPWTPVRLGPIEVGNASFVTLMCYLHRASGTVWFDDISMIEVTEEVAATLAQRRMQERFASDVTVARAMAVTADDQQALADLNALQERAWASELPTEVDYRAGPPWFALHGELFRIAAQINARRLPGAGPVVAWSEDPFAPFPPMQLVPEVQDSAAEVLMCVEERDQALVKLCNITQEPVEVEIALQQPRVDGAPALTLREVICIDPGGGAPTYGDPLPLLDMSEGRARMELAPGVVRGLWLQIDSRGAEPGRYHAVLTIAPEEAAAIEREVQIRVLPVVMPGDKPVVTWNYSYQNYWIMPERWEQARRDLVQHHINAYCWPARYLPWPKLDDDGRMLPLDWTAFDEGLRTHDNIRWLLLWPGFEWEGRLRLTLDLEPGSERWREVFIEWFSALRAGLAERGFGPDRVAWYLADEPVTEQRARAVVMTGEVIREIAPDALVLANPFRRVSWDVLRMMDPVVNLWCPALSMIDGEYEEFFRAGSDIWWSYQVLAKSGDPFASYRFSFWRCYQLGITGQGFWCYADAHGSNWDPYDHDRAEYAPVYDGDERELIPGRRWEGGREGVEDYTLLWMLDRAADAEGLTVDQRAAVDEAKTQVDRCLEARTVEAMMRARRAVLYALTAVSR